MVTGGIGFGDLTPVPGFRQYDRVRFEEILASTARFTQKGVTLAGGQGILIAGTAIARKTSNKKYYVYNNSGSGGLDTCKGILRDSVDTGTGSTSVDMLGNIVLSGILKNSMLSGVDSNAITDLNARLDDSRDWLVY